MRILLRELKVVQEWVTAVRAEKSAARAERHSDCRREGNDPRLADAENAKALADGITARTRYLLAASGLDALLGFAIREVR
jgi:hypothetical protein